MKNMNAIGKFFRSLRDRWRKAGLPFRAPDAPRLSSGGLVYRRSRLVRVPLASEPYMRYDTYTEPKWHDRLLEALTRAVASMVEIQKFIK